jgi:dCMP deaminase
MTDWDERFLQLAQHIAQWSKDPSTKVGAVIVRPNRTIASVGYNGFPRGVNDDERLNDRPYKYAMTVHAEANAILSANERLDGCTLYVTPLSPCSSCASILIQSGIKRVVAYMPHQPEHWVDSFAIARTMLDEAGIRWEIRS